MKLFIYAVYDSKMEVFGPPYVMINRATAYRMFGDMASDPQFPYGKHPKDYFLYEIGTYDDHSGAIEGSKPVNLGLLKQDDIGEKKDKKLVGNNMVEVVS